MFTVLKLSLLQWRPDKDKQLSGRIIRVKISCDYSTSRLTKTGCLVFKSSGQITCEYYIFLKGTQKWHFCLKFYNIMGDKLLTSYDIKSIIKWYTGEIKK